jgi:CelD/BcsL family acetyltransferase involved in cellulose biosynthesis
VEVRELRTKEQLETLRPHWNAVLKKTGRPSLYLTFEWLSTWWKCFEDDRRELYVLVVTEGEEILGIAPFMKVRSTFLGLRFVKIEFISASDYAFSHLMIAGPLEFILTERKSEVVAAIVSHLVSRQEEWAFLRLEPLADDSPTLPLMEAEARSRNLRTRRVELSPSFEIRIDSDWESYFSRRPAQFRRNLRRRERLLQRLGNVQFVHCDSLAQTENGFDDVLDIERRSWKWTRGMSINCVGYSNFFPVFADVMSQTGWLRLSFLRLDGRNIAYCYAAAYEGTEECFKTAYDKSFGAFSPGNLLQWRRFEQDFRKGASGFNLMRGAPNYKKCWSTHERKLREIFVFNSSRRSKVIYFFFFTLHLYGKFRMIPDLSKRLARRLGLTLKHSELTRMDQLQDRGDAGNGRVPHSGIRSHARQRQ